MRPTQTSRFSCSSVTLCTSILVLGLSATSTRCQAATPSGSTESSPTQDLRVQPKAQAATAKQPRVAFPANMLPVGQPGSTGTAPLGITADELFALTRSLFSNDLRCIRALKNASSELGRRDVVVDAFFLYKHPVTNKQYQVFVQKTGHRSPFHWWKWGKPENFRKHRNEIAKLAEELEKQRIERREAEIRYWESNYKDLEFAIPSGTEDHPVSFVSYNDAMAFCGWAGMRLPTEAEWTYAATGGERKIYLFGNDWDPNYPKKVGLAALRDRTGLKPVGSLGPHATGPFGHQDMLGQVWEWSLGLGFAPQADDKEHDKEYEKLRRLVEKDKRLSEKHRTLPLAVPRHDDYAVAKGSGSIYSFSYERWDQLRLNVRAPLSTNQTVRGLGFRPAKSYRVALDTTLSRLRSEYLGNQYFVGGRERQTWNLDAQDGVERYDLDQAGTLITDYHAISFTPTNFLTTQKKLRPKALEAHSMTQMLILGPLVTTETIKEPALKKGIYTVYYRHAGLPKELIAALKEGGTVLKKEEAQRLRAAKRGKPEKKAEPDEPTRQEKSKQKGPDWRQIIARHGFRTTDFLDEEGKVNRSFWKDVDYIYLAQPPRPRTPAGDKAKDGKAAAPTGPDRLKIPAKKYSLLIFRDNDGKWVSFRTIDKRQSLKYVSGSTKIANPVTLYAQKLTREQQKAGMAAHEVVEFNFGIPPTPKDAGRKYGSTRAVFKMVLELPDPPSPDRVWRTNYMPHAARAESSAGNGGNGKNSKSGQGGKR